MIYVDLPCIALCGGTDKAEDGKEVPCDAKFEPTLVLLSAGGLGIKKPPEGWQVCQDPKVLGGPFLVFCPKHRMQEQKIQLIKKQVGPAGPRFVTRLKPA